MNKSFLCFSFGLLCLALPGRAETVTVFKAAATLPVTMVIPFHTDPMGNFVDDKLVAKTLKGADLINLAMGRPLGSRVDAKTEVLALGVVKEGPGQVANGATRVIIYNPDQSVATDAQRIKATIFTIQNLDFDAATISASAATAKVAGQGIAQVTVTATPNPPPDPTGDAVKNALVSTVLNGAGAATATVLASDSSLTGFVFKLKSLAGPFHFKTLNSQAAQTDIDGIVTKGVFTTTGAALKILQLP